MAWAVVLSLHVTLLMLILRPVRPLQPDDTASRFDPVDVLEVRLIEASSASSRARPAAASAALDVGTHRVREPQSKHTTAGQPVAPPQQAQGKPREPATDTLSLKLTHRQDATSHWTIGRSLSAPARVTRRLPGQGHVHGAPVFHMIDPRMQGIAGVVRTAQALLGVANPHCVEVDAWRTMSRGELLGHHLTRRRVDEIAKRHGCMPPVRGDLSSDPFAH